MSNKVINFRDMEDEADFEKTTKREKNAFRHGGVKEERRNKRQHTRQRKGHS